MLVDIHPKHKQHNSKNKLLLKTSWPHAKPQALPMTLQQTCVALLRCSVYLRSSCTVDAKEGERCSSVGGVRGGSSGGQVAFGQIYRSFSTHRSVVRYCPPWCCTLCSVRRTVQPVLAKVDSSISAVLCLSLSPSCFTCTYRKQKALAIFDFLPFPPLLFPCKPHTEQRQESKEPCSERRSTGTTNPPAGGQVGSVPMPSRHVSDAGPS